MPKWIVVALRLLGGIVLASAGALAVFFASDAPENYFTWSKWEWAIATVSHLLGMLIPLLAYFVFGAQTTWPRAQKYRQKIHELIRSLSQRLSGELWISFFAPLSILLTLLLVGLYALNRFDQKNLHLYLGAAAILDVFLSLVIIANFERTRISSSQELLSNFHRLFRDGADHQRPVRIIHLFPNPGQFDAHYRLGSRQQFDALRAAIAQAVAANHPPEFVCLTLDGNQVAAAAAANRFLDQFWARESHRLSEYDQKDGPDFYRVAAQHFFDEVKALTAPIHQDWLDKALKGERLLLVGFAAEKGFLGSVRFTTTRFEFDGRELEGATAVAGLQVIYEALKSSYASPPPPGDAR